MRPSSSTSIAPLGVFLGKLSILRCHSINTKEESLTDRNTTALLLSPLPITAIGSVFVSSLGSHDKSYNLTLALNIPDRAGNPNELQYYFSAPVDQSWAAFGFGKGMSSALMFVFYWNAKQDNFTISPRISAGYVEPSYNSTIDHTLEKFGSGISPPNMIIRGRCRNCMTWPGGGKIDVDSTAQPMLYAMGPDISLHTDSVDAGLQRHDHFGQFTMDMKAADVDDETFGTTHDFLATANATEINGGDHKDHDVKTYAHAFFTAGVFLIVFPFGASYIRLISVRWHWIAQSVGVVGMWLGGGIGLALSRQYNQVCARIHTPFTNVELDEMD